MQQRRDRYVCGRECEGTAYHAALSVALNENAVVKIKLQVTVGNIACGVKLGALLFAVRHLAHSVAQPPFLSVLVRVAAALFVRVCRQSCSW